jgi:competence protein ComEC
LLIYRPMIVEPAPFLGEAELIEMPRRDESGQSAVVLASGHRLLLRLPSDVDASMGDRFRFQGRIEPLREGQWPRRGSVGRLERTSVMTRAGSGWPVWRFGRDWALSVEGFLARQLSGEAAEVLQALCFGRVGALSEEADEALRRSGLAHTAAASGANVLLVAGAALLTLPWTGLSRSGQYAGMALILILYGGAAGLQPSVVRAILMFLILAAAPMLRREPDGLASLGVSGLALLAADPGSAREPGFWMSVSATAGLILFVPWRQEARRIRDVPIRGLQASTAAFLATLPVSGLLFGDAPWLAPFANLAVALAVPAAAMAALLGWLVGLFFEPAGALIIQWLAGPWAAYLLVVAKSFGGLPFAVIRLPVVPDWASVLAWGAALAAWRPRARPI